jgi:tetratricopeptide (TPR) repeat protein
MRRLSLALSPLVLGLVLSTHAYAEDPAEAAKTAAKAHVEAGTKFYNVQQYEQAADEYQKAYLLDPRPAYLYASAQSQRLSGDCVKALRSYDAYLRTNPAEPEQLKAKSNIERCEQDLKDRAPPVAEIAPPIAIVPVPAPPPAPLPEALPPPLPPPPSYLPGHFLVAGGVAVTAFGVVALLRGRASIQDHNGAPTYDDFISTRDDLDGAKLQQTVGVSAIAVGGAMILGGVAFYALRSSGSASTVSASVVPGAASVLVTRSF